MSLNKVTYYIFIIHTANNTQKIHIFRLDIHRKICSMLFNETMSARCNWAINPQQNILLHDYLLCTNISLTVSCYHSTHIIMVTIQGLFVTTGLRMDSLSKKKVLLC